MKLPPFSPDDLIEELRQAAREELVDVFPHATDVTEMVYWEAAEMIEAFYAALKSIGEGADDPVTIANSAIDPEKWSLVARLSKAKD